MGSLLLAEDDPDVRDFVMKLFQRRGWEVLAVSSGDEAIAAFDEGSFDAVLTDYDMGPCMDGLAVARHVARIVPVVLHTGGDPVFSEEDQALFAAICMKGDTELVDLMDRVCQKTKP